MMKTDLFRISIMFEVHSLQIGSFYESANRRWFIFLDKDLGLDILSLWRGAFSITQKFSTLRNSLPKIDNMVHI